MLIQPSHLELFLRGNNHSVRTDRIGSLLKRLGQRNTSRINNRYTDHRGPVFQLDFFACKEPMIKTLPAITGSL